MTDNEQGDVRWQMVTCTKCERHYQCTPMDDYYGGLCTKCVVGDLPVVVVIPRNPPLRPANP